MDYKLCSRATFDLLTDYAVRRKVNAQTWGGTQGMSDAVRIFGQAYVRCHHFPEAIATVLYEANVASLATKIGQSNANDHRFTSHRFPIHRSPHEIPAAPPVPDRVLR